MLDFIGDELGLEHVSIANHRLFIVFDGEWHKRKRVGSDCSDTVIYSSVEIFADESVLKEDWQPEKLPEREGELDEIRNALAPATRGVNAHNLFLYGKTGQGKTVAIDHEINLLQEYADDQDDLNLSVTKTSANNQTASYQLCAHLIKEIRGGTKKPSGIDQQSMFDLLYDEVSKLKDTVMEVYYGGGCP